MDEGANILETVNSFKDFIRGRVKTTFIDLCTVLCISAAQLNAGPIADLILGNDTLGDQITYLRRTPKPRQLYIKDWIRRICEINNLISYFTLPATAITYNNLVTEVIEPNTPSHYSTKFNDISHKRQLPTDN